MSVKRKWTFEMLYAEANKYSTRGEFRKYGTNAYAAALRQGILDEVCCNLTYGNISWTFENLKATALLFHSRSDFQKKNKPAYIAAHSRGILDMVCSHMLAKLTHWEESDIVAEAQKYQTKTDFHTGDRRAYQAAITRGILDKVCSHMSTYQWTDVELKNEALNYVTRREFSLKNSGAYTTAWKRGILDNICSHMVRGKTGFDPNKNGALYLVSINKTYLGFGISNALYHRLRAHKTTFKKCGVTYEPLCVFKSSGYNVLAMENAIKERFVIIDTGIKGFRKEAVMLYEYDAVYEVCRISLSC